MALTRRNFVRAAGLAGAAGSVALLAGCARGAADSGANEPVAAGAAGAGVGPDGVSQVVITMTPSSEPAAGFDPLVGWGAGEHVHEPLIQSTLIATDNNLAFVNDLATDYGCSEDGLTWTFHIREGVMFTDGVPLTAEDVAFTINGIVNGEAAEADLSMVDEARAVDATTCEIAMKRPNNALLYTLAVVGIVPAHAYGPDYGEHPIGSGRYMLEQWDRGQQVILRANPDYYGDEAARWTALWCCSWKRTRRWPPPSRARRTWPTPRRRWPGRFPRVTRCSTALRWTPAASRCPAIPPAPM